MARGGKDRMKRRGGEGPRGQGVRGSSDDRWDPESPDLDPVRDVRDIYEELQDPARDEYVWPVIENGDED